MSVSRSGASGQMLVVLVVTASGALETCQGSHRSLHSDHRTRHIMQAWLEQLKPQCQWRKFVDRQAVLAFDEY